MHEGFIHRAYVLRRGGFRAPLNIVHGLAGSESLQFLKILGMEWANSAQRGASAVVQKEPEKRAHSYPSCVSLLRDEPKCPISRTIKSLIR